MPDYIKKEEAIQAMMKAQHDRTWSMSDTDVIECMEEYVGALPPAEVEEVKHGKWVWELQGIGKMNCKCTNCQEWFPIKYEDLDEYGSPERETKRCPNCGAIMEGSGEG